jgi:tryptophanase leader peptide
MKHRLSYRLIAQGGLNAWYNLDPRITNDFLVNSPLPVYQKNNSAHDV